MKTHLILNQAIWATLLGYEQQGTRLSISFIAKNFDITREEAGRYLFMLINRHKFANSHREALKINKFHNLIKEERVKTKELTEMLKNQESLISFNKTLKDAAQHESYFNMLEIKGTEDSKEEECTALAMLSDVHCDEIVEKSTTNGMNEFNKEIATERLNRYAKRLLYMIRMLRRSGSVVKHLVLGVLGDLISGYIHPELIENNSMSPTQATKYMQDFLIKLIRFLAKEGEFESITVMMIRGNHGRTTDKIRISTGYKNSFEHLMYLTVKEIVNASVENADKIKFIIPESEIGYLKIYDKVFRFIHGNQIRYMGGIGGVTIPLTRWIMKSNSTTYADVTAAAHFHQYCILPGYKALVNGSVIGWSAYAMSKGFEYEGPQQQLQIIDKKRGLTANLPVKLDDF